MKFILKAQFILYTFLFSCNGSPEEEIVPLPEALFTSSIQSVSIVETIDFVNNSVDAIRYEWDFGDGLISLVENPSHQYSELGLYEVKMKAFNAIGDSSIYTQNIYVGEKYISQIIFDASPDADLPMNMILLFGEVGDGGKSYFVIFPKSISQSDLPFGGEIDFGFALKLSDKDWFWTVIENKGDLDLFDAEDQLVFGTVFNPARITPHSRERRNGTILVDEVKSITGAITNNYKLTIGYYLK